MSDYDDSPVSSRESSPARGYGNEKAAIYQDIGRQPLDAYDTILPGWRAAIRRKIVESVHEESEIIARMQVSRKCCRQYILKCYSECYPFAMAGCLFCVHFVPW